MEEQAFAATPFADRLATAVVERRSQLVVGLDPRLELLPLELRGDSHMGRAAAAGAFTRFCRGLIDAVCPYVVAVKPQAACFEVLGADGMLALEEICDYAHTVGLIVIADTKRGDIGSTARAYASAYLEPRDGDGPLADAMTVSAYLGRDSLEPFVATCRRFGGGIFCLVKTSNVGGADVQDLTLTDGSLVWHHVARLVAELGEDVVGDCGLSSVGAVVGAVSRSVIYAFRFEGDDWRSAAGAEAARLRDEVWAASGW